MPAIDCTRSARTKFEIMYSAAFNNVPALFTPDHISHYFIMHVTRSQLSALTSFLSRK